MSVEEVADVLAMTVDVTAVVVVAVEDGLEETRVWRVDVVA